MIDNLQKHIKSRVHLNSSTIIPKICSVLICILFLITITSGTVAAEGNDSGNSDLGWILFDIMVVVLIIVVILWIVTYFIMRGVIKRLESERDKVVRYEKRKDSDREREYKEEARDKRRRERAPKGNCIICNRKFIPGADVYQCECGKFIHVHCLSDISLCPNCGRDINKEYGVVRLEGSEPSSTRASGKVTRTKINRLLKAKFCPVCNKIIKAGDSGMQCDRCEVVFHMKCSEKAKTCPKCGA